MNRSGKKNGSHSSSEVRTAVGGFSPTGNVPANIRTVQQKSAGKLDEMTIHIVFPAPRENRDYSRDYSRGYSQDCSRVNAADPGPAANIRSVGCALTLPTHFPVSMRPHVRKRRADGAPINPVPRSLSTRPDYPVPSTTRPKKSSFGTMPDGGAAGKEIGALPRRLPPPLPDEARACRAALVPFADAANPIQVARAAGRKAIASTGESIMPIAPFTARDKKNNLGMLTLAEVAACRNYPETLALATVRAIRRAGIVTDADLDANSVLNPLASGLFNTTYTVTIQGKSWVFKPESDEVMTDAGKKAGIPAKHIRPALRNWLAAQLGKLYDPKGPYPDTRLAFINGKFGILMERIKGHAIVTRQKWNEDITDTAVVSGSSQEQGNPLRRSRTETQYPAACRAERRALPATSAGRHQGSCRLCASQSRRLCAVRGSGGEALLHHGGIG